MDWFGVADKPARAAALCSSNAPAAMNTALLPLRCSGPPCFARLFPDEPLEPRIPEIMLAGHDTAQQPLLRVIRTAVESAPEKAAVGAGEARAEGGRRR